jgi:hypothetical protein
LGRKIREEKKMIKRIKNHCDLRLATLSMLGFGMLLILASVVILLNQKMLEFWDFDTGLSPSLTSLVFGICFLIGILVIAGTIRFIRSSRPTEEAFASYVDTRQWQLYERTLKGPYKVHEAMNTFYELLEEIIKEEAEAYALEYQANTRNCSSSFMKYLAEKERKLPSGKESELKNGEDKLLTLALSEREKMSDPQESDTFEDGTSLKSRVWVLYKSARPSKQCTDYMKAEARKLQYKARWTWVVKEDPEGGSLINGVIRQAEELRGLYKYLARAATLTWPAARFRFFLDEAGGIFRLSPKNTLLSSYSMYASLMSSAETKRNDSGSDKTTADEDEEKWSWFSSSAPTLGEPELEACSFEGMMERAELLSKKYPIIMAVQAILDCGGDAPIETMPAIWQVTKAVLENPQKMTSSGNFYKKSGMIQALTTERLNIMQLIMQAFGVILAFIGFIVVAGTYLERSSGFERIDSRSDSTSYVAGGVIFAISASLWAASRQRACVKAAVQFLEELKEDMNGEDFSEDVDSDRSVKFSAYKQSFRGSLQECWSGVDDQALGSLENTGASTEEVADNMGEDMTNDDTPLKRGSVFGLDVSHLQVDKKGVDGDGEIYLNQGAGDTIDRDEVSKKELDEEGKDIPSTEAAGATTITRPLNLNDNTKAGAPQPQLGCFVRDREDYNELHPFFNALQSRRRDHFHGWPTWSTIKWAKCQEDRIEEGDRVRL